jgi:hypothetical protein
MKPSSKKNVWYTPAEDYDNTSNNSTYESLDIPEELEDKVEKLMQFFDKNKIKYDKYNPEDIPKLDLDKKQAYPNYEHYMNVPGQHDTQKWLQAVKAVYHKERGGLPRINAIRQAVAGWNLMEVHDFLNWLKFYEEGAHLKYKFAQLWYENGEPGYFLHIKKDPEKVPEPPVTGKDIDFARDSAGAEMPSSEKKSIIEKQRHKIIGRLDSAEKLLRSEDGQMFAGKELESLMEAIYNLKKKVSLVNKLSTSTKLYEDMIIREANSLNKRGFVKASEILYSVAQEAGMPAKKTDKSPPVSPPSSPIDASGAPGGLPSVGPGMPQTPPDSAPNEMPPKAIEKFLENLDTGKITTNEDKNDNSDVDDDLEVNDELLVTEAQEIPPPPPPKAAPKEKLREAPAVKTDPVTDKPIEVSEDDTKTESTSKDFDNMIDAAFANLSINDVVAKLEDLAKIFKTREVPRQLSIVDMMLDSLGLASFFPSLSEATNKALESNNYISTRVEDIISKLRGAMETKDIDLKGNEQEVNPAVQGIKDKLQQNDEKEKARKEQRKAQQNSELDNAGKETPEIEIDEDLATPPAAPKVPPTPAAPPV